jgi:hypothetical protein
MDWDKPRNNRRIPYYQIVTFLGMQYLAPEGKEFFPPLQLSFHLFPSFITFVTFSPSTCYNKKLVLMRTVVFLE